MLSTAPLVGFLDRCHFFADSICLPDYKTLENNVSDLCTCHRNQGLLKTQRSLLSEYIYELINNIYEIAVIEDANRGDPFL